jgi:catechol 2,3-dioxygenase-like lactoylglutathione lyase family enzyme
LRSELRDRKQVDLTHSDCLEIVAAQFGFDDWNVLAAKIGTGSDPSSDGGHSGTASTIPILRIFSEPKALEFYVDFLGFTLDFGGPNLGPGTPFYGQVTRAATTLHLSEHPYDPGHGASVYIWLSGLDDLHRELSDRYGEMGSRIWGPAVWVPRVEDVAWDARVLTISDPFGNHLRLSEPNDEAFRRKLARWVK